MHLYRMVERRRTILILLLFLFIPLPYYPVQNWFLTKINTGNSTYNYGKITYPIENLTTGLELTFMRGSFGIRATASVRRGEIPPYRGNAREAVATISLEGQQNDWIVYRMEGGQELLFPEEMATLMQEALANDRPFSLLLDGYEALITPCSFCKMWNRLMKVAVCWQAADGEGN